jgi:hypothetical protein
MLANPVGGGCAVNLDVRIDIPRPRRRCSADIVGVEQNADESRQEKGRTPAPRNRMFIA